MGRYAVDLSTCLVFPGSNLLDGVVRAIVEVKALQAATATGLEVSLRLVSTSSLIEVLESDAEKYTDVGCLCFSRKTHRIRTDKGKKVLCLRAPIDIAPSNMLLNWSSQETHPK